MQAQTEANKAIVHKFNKEFIEGGDFNVFDEIVADDFINHTAPAGAANNKAGVGDFIGLLRKALPDITVEITDQVAEEDKVVTRKYFHATHQGELMGIKPSFRKVKLYVIDIIRLKDGKYTEHWSIRDFADLMEQSRLASAK